MKKIFTLILLSVLGVGSVLHAQKANVRFIHDSPDPALDSMDIYINDSLYPGLTNFHYLHYTAFLNNIPAGVPITFAFAHAHSTGPTDTLFTLPGVTFTADSYYVVTFAGVIDTSSFHHDANSNISFNAFTNTFASGGTGANNHVKVMLFNGIVDAPPVDIFIRGYGYVMYDIPFGQYDTAGFVVLPAQDYIIEVRDTSGNVLNTFYAALAAAENLGETLPAIVYAAGFVDTTQGPAFDLYADAVALESLGVAPFPAVKTAQAQFIHNAADPLLDSVDVFVMTAPDSAVIDSFHTVLFRNATPFISLPSQIPMLINFSPLHSTATTPPIVTTQVGGLTNYSANEIIASGVVNYNSFGGNPNGRSTIFVGSEQKLLPALSGDSTGLLFFNGATDADITSVKDSTSGSVYGTGHLIYGNFSTGYVNVLAADHIISVTDSLAAGSTVYTYDADETGLGDSALTIFASGFADTTSGPRAFGLWAAKANGTTYPLTLRSSTFTSGIADVSAAKNIVLYPNPASSSVFVGYSLEQPSEVQYSVVNILGQTIQSVNLGNTNSGSNSLKLNVAGYAKGMYMLNLVVGNNSATTIRFVVE